MPLPLRALQGFSLNGSQTDSSFCSLPASLNVSCLWVPPGNHFGGPPLGTPFLSHSDRGPDGCRQPGKVEVEGTFFLWLLYFLGLWLPDNSSKKELIN